MPLGSTLRRQRRAAIAGAGLSALVFGLAASCAFAGNEPSVITQSSGVFVAGKLELDVTCTALANQTGAQVTVIKSCYTTNGVVAAGNTGVGPVAQAEGVGEVQEVAGMQVCVDAYSLNSFGVRSDEFTGCQGVDPLAGSVAHSGIVMSDPKRFFDCPPNCWRGSPSR